MRPNDFSVTPNITEITKTSFFYLGANRYVKMVEIFVTKKGSEVWKQISIMFKKTILFFELNHFIIDGVKNLKKYFWYLYIARTYIVLCDREICRCAISWWNKNVKDLLFNNNSQRVWSVTNAREWQKHL